MRAAEAAFVRISNYACQDTSELLFAVIGGVPGTGKTATVHAVIRELKRMAEQDVCIIRDSIKAVLILIFVFTGRKSVHIRGNQRSQNSRSFCSLWSALGSHIRS